jgi:hypothetical protein
MYVQLDTLMNDPTREARLRRTEPERFGLCVACMQQFGAESPAVASHLCEPCLTSVPPNVEALADALRDLATPGDVEHKHIAKLLALAWPVVGAARVAGVR